MPTKQKLRALVADCENEQELNQKWLNIILRDKWNSDLEGVQYERNVIEGRFDVRLVKNARAVAIIELKCPKKTRSQHLGEHFLQAYKYAHSMYVWRAGVLSPVIGVLSNGKRAIIFDGSLSLDEAESSATTLDLSSNDLDLQRFLKLIEQLSSDKKTEFHFKGEIRSSKHLAKSADQSLSQKLYEWYERCTDSGVEGKLAFQMVLQLYLISICRDCGFIPTPLIREYEGTGNWRGVVDELKHLFNEEFIIFNELHAQLAWHLYDETRRLPVRLDYIPPDCLGLAYETLSRRVNGLERSKTSFYTPVELIDEILAYTKPSASEYVLDPTCGSAAFLSACVAYVFPKEASQKEIKKYIDDKLVGVDRDWHACQIAKAALLSAYATRIPYDLGKIGRKGLDIPKPKIYHVDYFDWLAPRTFDVILGNPPWGSIDSENALEPALKGKISEYDVYQDKNDVCVYVVEKAYNELKKSGRFGFLCKRQVIDGSKHTLFQDWLSGRAEIIADFGDMKLFNNSAQTAMILGRKDTNVEMPTIVPRESSLNVVLNFKSETTFESRFYCVKGWESAANKVYSDFAQRQPRSKWIRKIAPNKSNFSFFGLPSSYRRLIALVSEGEGTEFSKELTKEERIRLESRAAILRSEKDKYAWAWLLNFDLYSFSGKQTRLVIPGVWSSERIPCIIDNRGEMIGITSHTIMIPRKGTTREETLVAAGWISTSMFHRHALTAGRAKRMGDGGIALYPEYIARCSIPIASNAGEIAFYVEDLIAKKGSVTPADLKKLDKLFVAALVELGTPRELLKTYG